MIFEKFNEEQTGEIIIGINELKGQVDDCLSRLQNEGQLDEVQVAFLKSLKII